MKNNKHGAQFPKGWDEKRVGDVIAHYESQTDDERLAEIQDASLDDAWRRFKEAYKQFNKTNQSKLIPTPFEADSEEAALQFLGENRYCHLNWCGIENDTPFSVDFHVEFAVQGRLADRPIRPVLCTISKSFVCAPALPASRKAIAELLAACVQGVKLELEPPPLPEAERAFLEANRSDGVKLKKGERKKGLFIKGISTTLYAKSIDSETLSDSLTRLIHSAFGLREKLGLEKLAW